VTRFSDYLADMQERGSKFLDRLGRGRRASAHVRTILGDSVVDTYNQAQVLRARGTGATAMLVHDALLGDTDEPCETANGQTWSPAYAQTHLKQHPNCTREFTVLRHGDERDLDRVEGMEET